MNSITKRVDAITNMPADRRAASLAAPKSVKIELTARCNFMCAFCARSQRLRDQGDMDRGFYERTVSELRKSGVEELGVFYLGESFMLPWLPEAIAFAKGVGFPYVFVTTNGSLSTPTKVRACLNAGLDSLKFSLNYSDREQFVEVAAVKPKLFDAMIRNIKAAHGVRAEGGFDCGLYASFIEYDDHQGGKMAALVDEIRPFVDEVYALPLYNQANAVTEEEEARGWKPTAGNRGRVGALRDPIPCWAAFTEGHITFDGKLSACCFDHDGRFHMGDLNEVSFMEAWNSKAFRDLRTAHLAGDVTGTACETCVAYQ